MAERYTRQYRRNELRKDVRLVEVPPTLFSRTNGGSPVPSSTTNYDEQTRTVLMYDDTEDQFGPSEPLHPTFPYRQCYESGRPYLYSQQQVVPSPGRNVCTTVPSGAPTPGTTVDNDNGNRPTPGTMASNGNGNGTVPSGGPTPGAMAGTENDTDPQPYRYQQPRYQQPQFQQPQYQQPQYQQPQYQHPQLPQASAYNAHCPPLDNLWKTSNSSSSEMVLPPHDVFTNSGMATGSSSSAMDDDSRKYRKTMFGLGPRLAAAICMITVLTVAAIVVCIVISQETLQ